VQRESRNQKKEQESTQKEKDNTTVTQEGRKCNIKEKGESGENGKNFRRTFTFPFFLCYTSPYI
jgi:hypothetical protein